MPNTKTEDRSRRPTSWALPTLALAAVGFGLHECQRREADAAFFCDHRATVGTLRAPRFLVTATDLHTVPTWSQLFDGVETDQGKNSRPERLERLTREVSQVDALVRRWGVSPSEAQVAARPVVPSEATAQLLQTLPQADAGKVVQQWLSLARRELHLLLYYPGLPVYPQTPSWSEFCARASVALKGDEENSLPPPTIDSQTVDFVDGQMRAAFETLTGQTMPQHWSIAIVPEAKHEVDKPGRTYGGGSFYRSGRMEVVPGNPILMFLVGMHETGHQIAQHQEESDYLGEHPRLVVSTMEEASAYCFQLCGVGLVRERDARLAALAFTLLPGSCAGLELMECYLRGDETESHDIGFAVAMAACEVLGSPTAAFNYLAVTRYNELSTPIQQMLTEYRARFQQRERDAAQTAEGQLIWQIGELQQRLSRM